tara:strand:+ start:104 stop:508 length:405 start_codon:yes stop_codon:yes gene_type:complete
MYNIKINLKSNLQTEIKHLESGKNIATDAPKDNSGLGLEFSPTDLLVSSLGSCIFTIMAIVAEARDFELNNAKMEITKTMSNKPRMVEKIGINIYLNKKINKKNRILLEKSAFKCPVCRSLNPKIIKEINFYYI